MRKLIYHIATSLDGYIAHQDGDISGFLMEGKHADDFARSIKNYDTVVMGTNTYKFGFQYGLKPGQPAYQGLKHLIVSRSLNFESNSTVELLASGVQDYIRDQKKQESKDIWLCGGGHLAGFLLNKGLIDEVHLKVNPFALGDGIRLFENAAKPVACDLFDIHRYDNGVVLQRYKVNRNQSSNLSQLP